MRVRSTCLWSCVNVRGQRRGSYRETLLQTLIGCRSILHLPGPRFTPVSVQSVAPVTVHSPVRLSMAVHMPCSHATTHLPRPPFLVDNTTSVPPQRLSSISRLFS